MESFKDDETKSFLRELPRDLTFRNKSLQIVEPTFGVNILPIPEQENPDIHYRCPKCFNFPKIEFIDKNEEIIIYTCCCYKNKRVPVKDLFYNGKDISKKFMSFPDSNNILINIDNNNNTQKKEEILGYKCIKHISEQNNKIENNNFEYYCFHEDCCENLCKDCLESHLKQNHEEIGVFDYQNFETIRKVNEILKFENKNKIFEINDDNESTINLSGFENSMTENERKEKNDKDFVIKQVTKNVSKIVPKVDKEKIHKTFIEFINIIIHDYTLYPNYSHFVNIDNIYRFLIKEPQKKKEENQRKENQRIKIRFILTNGNKHNLFFSPFETIKDIKRGYLYKSEPSYKFELFYNEYKLEDDMIIKDIITERDKIRNMMDIIVSKISEFDNIQIREVKCPKCYDNILLDILDYKFHLHDCKNGHSKSKILFNDFMKTQKNNDYLYCYYCYRSSIFPTSFYKCFSCKKNLCLSCKEKHDKKHEIMNLEEINSICNIHRNIS